MPIPQRIVQTHRSEDIGRDQRASWAAHHPGWEIAFYDDAACRQFMAERLPAILPTYDKLPLPVQKADLFRYAAIYELGGVYCDVDTICHAPVGSYVDLDAGHMVIGLEMSPAEFPGPLQYYPHHYFVPFQLLQWTFAAPPRHPALALMIQRIHFYASQASAEQLRAWSVSENFTLGLTGPGLFTQVINEFLAGSREGTVSVLRRSAWGLLPSEAGRPEWAGQMKVQHLFEGAWKPKAPPAPPVRFPYVR
jgi:mannosyltransferase OCH1-like enzyme